MTTSPHNQFRLYTGNNLEALAKAYADARMAQKAHFRKEGFFANENICVATQGMRVWLEHYLVQQGHVVAGIQFQFLRDAIDGILATFMKDDSTYRPELFKEDVLIWRIYRLLTEDNLKGDLALLADYLNNETDDTKDVRRYQLARKLAQVYYDYIAFVPEKLHPQVVEELTGKHPAPLAEADQWQLTLWQKLCLDENNTTVTSPAEALLRFLAKNTTLKQDDYTPVTFFGVSAMPPYFLLVLKKLSTVQPVNFFYLNHCDDLWDDVKAEWEKGKIGKVEKELDEHFGGNSLLGNFGIQGREFFKVVMDEEDFDQTYDLTAFEYDKNWENQAKDTTSQSDATPCLLQDLQERVKNNDASKNAGETLPDWDDSVTIHSCFNEIREVEALQDCLLKLIKKYHHENRHLSMNDIIVMAPDISKFAPAIQAVFGRGPLKSHFCISDRSVRSANLLAETFARILDIPKSRFEVSRITALLDSLPLRARFGFEDDDVEVLRNWFNKAGIRWGRNEEDRADAGNFEEYSWQYGLDRMLLKLAVDGQDGNNLPVLSLGNLSPLDFASSGENQKLLSGLIAFFQALADFANEVQETKDTGRTAGQWCELLKEKRQAFFQTDADSALEYSMLGKALDALEKDTLAAGLAQDKIPFETIHTALVNTLDNPASGEPFLNGKITFCSLLPMRGIPCKIIAMLGMDVGEFPRQNDTTGFNLVCRKDDQGNYCGNLLKYYNRSRSIEDRFTFLEAIMSARDYLLIFYKGQNDQTLKELVAAAPVCELRDYINTIRTDADGILVKHLLNPFDPKCFQKSTENKSGRYDGALRQNFSFDARMAAVAKTLQESPSDATPFHLPFWLQAYTLPLPKNDATTPPEERTLVIELSDLEKFLKNPSEMYASLRLGLPKNPWEDPVLSDYEPFEIDALNSAKIKRALGPILAQLDSTPTDTLPPEIEQIYQLQKSACVLPPGTFGRLSFENTLQEACIPDEQFWHEFAEQEKSAPEDFEIDFGCVNPGQNAFMRSWLKNALETSLEKADATQQKTLRDAIQNNLNAFGKNAYRIKVHGNFRYYNPQPTPEEESPAVPGVRECLYAKPKGHHLIPIFLKHLMLAAKKFDNGTVDSKKVLSNYFGKNEIHSMTTAWDHLVDLTEVPGRIQEAIALFKEYADGTEIDKKFTDRINDLEQYCAQCSLNLQKQNQSLCGVIEAVEKFKDTLEHGNKAVGTVLKNLQAMLNDLRDAQNTGLSLIQKNVLDSIEVKFTNGNSVKSSNVEKHFLTEYNDALQTLQNCQAEYSKLLQDTQDGLEHIIAGVQQLAQDDDEGSTMDDAWLELCDNISSIRASLPKENDEINIAKEKLRRIVVLYLWNQFYPIPLFRDDSPSEAGPKRSPKAKSPQTYTLETTNERMLFQESINSQNLPKGELKRIFGELARYCYDGVGNYSETDK